MPPVAAAAAALGGAFTAAAGAVGFGAGAPLVGTGLLASAYGTTAVAGISLTGIATQLVVGASLSAISRALAPSVRSAGSGTRVQLSFGEDAPASFILGRAATAGDLVYANSWGNEDDTPNEYLVQVIELADLPAKLSRVWINGEWATLKPEGGFAHSTHSPGNPVEGYEKDGEDRLFVKFHDGTQNQADFYLREKFGDDEDRPWLADMIGRGTPYLIVTAGQRRGIHRQRPQVMAELIGSHYDRRRDSTAGGTGAQRWGDPATWRPCDNPIVLLDNVLRGIKDPVTGDFLWGGQDIGNTALPASVWFAAMNECDRAVELAGGGTEAQYRAGMDVRVDMEPAAVAEALLLSCQGLIANVAGQWHVRAGAPGPSVYSFSDDDLIVGTPDEFKPFPGLSDAYNAVAASYPEPEDGWKPKPAPVRKSDAFLAADGGRVNTADLKFDAVPYRKQVQRLQKSALRDGRRFRRHTFSLPPEAWPLTVLDEVSWTSRSNGYQDKDWSLSVVRDLPGGNVGVGLQERDPSDYDWSTADELPDSVGGWKRPLPRDQVANFDVDPAEVGNRPAIRLSWRIKRNVTGIRYRVRLASSHEIIPTDGLSPTPEDRRDGGLTVRGEPVTARGEAVTYSRIANVEAGEFFISEGLERSTAYQVQAIYEPVRGRKWSAWLPVTTPDVRIKEEDLEDQIRDHINDARDAADAAATNAQQALDKANEVETLVSSLGEGALDDLREIVDQLAGLDAGTVNEIRGIAIAGARKGWVTDPTFDAWTGATPTRWTVTGANYLSKVAGSNYPSALRVVIPTGPDTASVQASSDVGGQMIASVDPSAEYVALGALVRIYGGSLVGRLRLEWKNASTGNWARGHALGVNNWLGDLTSWGFAVDPDQLQSRELVVQKPVTNASAIRLVFELKRTGVTAAVDMRVDYLDVRALTAAEVKGFQANGYADAAIETFRTTIEGPSGAIAAMATTLRAEYAAADASVSNTVVALANDVEAIAGTIDVVQSSFGGRGLVPNGSFEDGVRAAGETPAYWSSWNDNFSVVQRGGSAPVSTAPSRYMGRIAGDTTQRTARAHMAVRVKPGQIVRANLQAAASGGNATIGIRFRALGPDAVTLVDSVLRTITVGSTWTTSDFATFTIPAGASYYETWVVRNAATTAITAYFTGVEATIGDEVALATATTAVTTAANAQSAVASMQTTIAAEFGSFASFIEQTATAVATADMAASAYVLRAVAGGGSAGLRLVAWDDETGTGGAVVVDAPNLIAPGTLSAGELVITDLGFNLVPDDQLQSFTAWGLGRLANSDGFWLNKDTGLDFASQGEIRWDDTSGSGNVSIVGQKFPVRPGDTLNCRFQYARLGSSGTVAGAMQLSFQKRDGSTSISAISDFSTNSGSVSNSGRTLVTVPAGCFSARWRVVVDKSASNAGGRFGGFEVVKKSGASTLITPDGAFFADLSAQTAWIDTANIVNGAIVGAKIGTAEIGTVKIAGFAVTDDADLTVVNTVTGDGMGAAYQTYDGMVVNIPNAGTRVTVCVSMDLTTQGYNLTNEWDFVITENSSGSDEILSNGSRILGGIFQPSVSLMGFKTISAAGNVRFRLKYKMSNPMRIARMTMLVSQRKR